MSGFRQRNKGRGTAGDQEDPPTWTQEEAKRFFDAFQEYNMDWEKVSQAVRSKGPAYCEALYRNFKSFLSLPKPLLNATAFLAVVKDSLKLEDSEGTVSDNHTGPDASVGESEGSEGNLASAERRSARLGARGRLSAGSKYGRQVAMRESPSWGGRRPRGGVMRVSPVAESIQKQSPAGNRRRSIKTQLSPEADDEEGVDALLSLAAVAQEASYEHDSPGEREDGRPVRKHKKPRRHIEAIDDEDYDASPRTARTSTKEVYSPPGRRRTLSSGRKVRSPAMEPMPPRTPSSRSKRDKGKASATARAQAEARRSSASRKAEAAVSRLSVPDSGLRQSARGRRRARDDDEEDYEIKATGKRGRKGDAEESNQWDEEEVETNLEAEKEDLEDVEEEEEEHDWFRQRSEPLPRRRRRKGMPEKPPPMMASAKTLFARRNSSLSISAPPPAFWVGVPPSQALASGVETEGQTSMGTAELRLRRCLAPRVRRWCSYEFFCSSIDRPWLMRNELSDYLNHVGIPPGTRLTRAELAIIRASLGQPRRLSLGYLRQERIKLELWRAKVRQVYAELPPGVEVPPDIPRQLQVGQKVTARHPITRQLHDGDVLTVTSNSYRVQFERRELGVELVKDVDVMPSDPLECLPANVLTSSPQVVLNGRQAGRVVARNVQLSHTSPPSWMESTQRSLAELSQGQPAGSFLQAPTPIRNLADMKAALDAKEDLLAQLKRMNDEVDLGMHKEENGQRPEAFQKAYAQVLVDLQLMNKLLDNSSFTKQLPAASPSSSQPPISGVAAQSSEGSPPQGKGLAWEGIREDADRMVTDMRIHIMGQENSGRPPSQGAEHGGGGAGREESSQPEFASGRKFESALTSTVTGCIGLLITLHQCSENRQKAASVDAALQSALQAIKPTFANNDALFRSIKTNVEDMKSYMQFATDA